MEILWVILGIILLGILFLWSLYNGFVRESTEIEEAWSQISVQLKRRVDLIPNLVEAVKGYAKHEKGVFEQVTKARSSLLGAQSPQEKAAADNMLTGALKSLFAVAENYPKLEASENFRQLQRELSDTEDKIAYARQYYNTQVLEYNLKVKIFPNSLFAPMWKFTVKEFFQADASDQKPVKVSFS